MAKKGKAGEIKELVNRGDLDAIARAEVDAIKQVRRMNVIADDLARRIADGDALNRQEFDTLSLEFRMRSTLLNKQVPDLKALSVNVDEKQATITGTVVLPSLTEDQRKKQGKPGNKGEGEQDD